MKIAISLSSIIFWFLRGKRLRAAPPCRGVSDEGAPNKAIHPFSTRGNNNVKRKKHFGMEVWEHHIYLSLLGFVPEFEEFLKTTDSIRYEFILPHFIKHVYHLHYYHKIFRLFSHIKEMTIFEKFYL